MVLTFMRFSLFPALGLAASAIFSGSMPASAQTAAQTQQNQTPVLAELFTSQSCSSCPSAERFFNQLADDDSVVAIQWHVDYWDNLVHGRDGKWKDPYSSEAPCVAQAAFIPPKRSSRVSWKQPDHAPNASLA